jgi:hypothetical protein
MLILISGGRNLLGQSKGQLQDRRRYVDLFFIYINFILFLSLFYFVFIVCLALILKNALENKHKNN